MAIENLVAITGMPGARKSDVATLFAKGTGAKVVNMSSIIREELLKEGLSPTPCNYHEIGLKLREKYGDHFLAKTTLPLLHNSTPFGIVDGIRTLAELNYFRSNSIFFRQVFVHASSSMRFGRMKSRSGPELQNTGDLMAQDERDLSLGLGGVIALSDYVIVNGGYVNCSFESMCAKVLDALMTELSLEGIDNRPRR